MDKEIVVAIVGSSTTAVVAAMGWIFGWLMQRDATARERQRSRLGELEYEVGARMEVEKVANEWLGELTDRTPQSVMLEVRKRAEEKSGFRPQMSARDLNYRGRATTHSAA